MATQGSFNTTAYGSYNRYLTFSWKLKTQSTENNYSVITWELKGAGGSSTTNYYYSAPFKVVINGKTEYESSTRIQLKNGTLVASGEVVISHNTDGKKTFTASAQGAIYSYSINSTGSGSWELTQIPRGAKLTGATNSNDEENPTITLVNAAGNSVNKLEIILKSADESTTFATREITDKTVSTYKITLTDTERNNIRKACANANSMKVKYILKTTIGSNTFTSSQEKTITIINANPTLSPVVVDTNSATVAITGNNKILVKGHSTPQCITNASAVKYATITGYKITNGSYILEADKNYMSNIQSGTTTFKVIDSRGNAATQTITNSFVDYIELSLNISATNITTAGATTLKVRGRFFDEYIGKTRNTLTITYCVSANGGSFDSWKNITPTKEDNGYSANVPLTGFNYQNTYKIKVRAVDEFNDLTQEIDVMSKPVFEWGKDVFCINANSTEGNIYGLHDLTRIPDNSNINDYVNIGAYSVPSNASAETMENLPSYLAGRLIVYSSTGVNTVGSSYIYLIQEYHTYDNSFVYKRYINKSTSNWMYHNWIRQSGSVVLWSGARAMTGSETITLSGLISEQPNGIVLRFCSWNGTTANYGNIQEFFVPKDFIIHYSGKAHNYIMASNGFAIVANKYIYI